MLTEFQLSEPIAENALSESKVADLDVVSVRPREEYVPRLTRGKENPKENAQRSTRSQTVRSSRSVPDERCPARACAGAPTAPA